MNTAPLVSVITPFLNAERYLQEAIESVLAQSYPRWELLLIDDGSRDRSSDIAKSFAAAHPEKIRYIDHPNHENRGKSTSRNLGARQAKGDFIALLDSDDLFLPQKLEQQLKKVDTHSRAGMVYGATKRWFSWPGSNVSGKDYLGKLGVIPNRLYEPPELLKLYLQDPGIVPCVCGILLRRQLFFDLGGFDEKIQHIYEDQILLAKVCLNSAVYVESGCWDLYRQHRESSCQIAMEKGEYHPSRPNPARFTYLQWLRGYIENNPINDAALQSALERAFFPYEHPVLYRLRTFPALCRRRLLRPIARGLKRMLLSRPDTKPAESLQEQ